MTCPKVHSVRFGERGRVERVAGTGYMEMNDVDHEEVRMARRREVIGNEKNSKGNAQNR